MNKQLKGINRPETAGRFRNNKERIEYLMLLFIEKYNVKFYTKPLNKSNYAHK
jgi:hypothetical protein